MLEGHAANHMKWQEDEIQELRRLYEDERKTRRDLEEEYKQLVNVLAKEIEVLKERLLEASKK